MEIIVRSRYCIGDVVETVSYGNLTIMSIKVHKLVDTNASLNKELIEYCVFNGNHNFLITENDLMELQKEKANERN